MATKLERAIKESGVVTAVLTQEDRLRREPLDGDPFSTPLKGAMNRLAQDRYAESRGPLYRKEVDLARIREEAAEAAPAASKPPTTRAMQMEKVTAWLASLPPEKVDAIEDAALSGQYGERQSDVIVAAIDHMRAAANYQGASPDYLADEAPEEGEDEYRTGYGYDNPEEDAAELLASLSEEEPDYSYRGEDDDLLRPEGHELWRRQW